MTLTMNGMQRASVLPHNKQQRSPKRPGYVPGGLGAGAGGCIQMTLPQRLTDTMLNVL